MGRPRGAKGRKSIEAAKNEDASSGGEEVIPAYKRRGRPQKHPKDGDHVDEEEEDDDSVAKTEEDDDDTAVAKADASTKTVPPSKEPRGSAQNGGGSKKRQRQLKRGSADSAATEEKGGAPAARPNPNGFRQNGSRRKNSTPRRAAEAGVECK
ncbi:hypothetical protein ABZP36_035416 [Zizania latifolia]